MANGNINVASRDESVANAKKITRILEEAVDSCNQFLKAGSDLQGIAGLSEYTGTVAAITKELSTLVEKSHECTKTIEEWYAKFDEMDAATLGGSLTGGM